MAEIYKGPYIITRVSDNNTATVKTPHGAKEYNYNTQMFKLYHPKLGQLKKENKEREDHMERESETKRQRKTYPGREDKRILAEKMEDHLQDQKRLRKIQKLKLHMQTFSKPKHQK